MPGHTRLTTVGRLTFAFRSGEVKRLLLDLDPYGGTDPLGMFPLIWRERAVEMAMLPPPPTKPITLPWQRGFSGGGKKEEYAKPRTEGRELSYGKIGLTTVAVTQDLLSGMPLVLKIGLIRLLEQYITWTRTTQCPTVQTHTPHCM